MIKLIIVLLNIPRLLPHILFYFIYKGKLARDIVNNSGDNIRYGNCIALLCMLVFCKPFRNLFYYRIGKWQYLFAFLLPKYETFIIGTEGFIDEGMRPAHCYATVVNADRIGKDFMIFQNVTVGMSNGGKPTIGNDVVIFSNSVVVGRITIGDHVRIGAGTVLCKSVPDNCVVVGNPARIVRRNGLKCNEKL